MPSGARFRAWLSLILGLVALAVSTTGHCGDRILLSILDPLYPDVLGVYGIYVALGMLLYAVPFLCGASLFLGIPARSFWAARIGVAFCGRFRSLISAAPDQDLVECRTEWRRLVTGLR